MALPSTKDADEEINRASPPIRDREAGDNHIHVELLSIHPIPCMQGAFEESIMESTDPALLKKAYNKLNAHARRQQLLELDDFSEEYSSRWGQKPGAKFHPLWKLIAQISFGVNLLHQQQARSDVEVVQILQTHVDEVDNFLQDTMADLDLAIKDIDERIGFLLLALEHGRTFNKMLNDKTFRSAIIDGNDIIERILAHTSRAVSNSLRDINTGMAATFELGKFLERLGRDWTNSIEDLHGVDTAMCAMRGNTDGWSRCFEDLQFKSNHLTRLIVQLQSIVGEVAKRCGIASRKRTSNMSCNEKEHHKDTLSGSRAPPKPRPTRINTIDKPLPPDPLNQAMSRSQIRNALDLSKGVHQEKPQINALPLPPPNQEACSLRQMPPSHGSANLLHIVQLPCIMAMPIPKASVAISSKGESTSRRADPEVNNLHSMVYAGDCVPKRSEDSSPSTAADSGYYSGSDTLLASHHPKTNPPSPMQLATIPSGVGSSIPSSRKKTSKHASKPSLTALPPCPSPLIPAKSLAMVPDVNRKKQHILNNSSLVSIKSIFARKRESREKHSFSGSLGGHVVLTELP